MRVVIKFKERTVIWNINAKCRKAVAPVAKAFGMTVAKFLEAKTRGKLPGQGCGRPSMYEMPAMPKAFAVTVGDPVWQKRLEAAAEYGKHSAREEVWRDLVGFVECLLDDTIQHPTTGKILCENDAFDEFRTETCPNTVARNGAIGKGIPRARRITETEAAITHLQKLLARRFGTELNTDSGAGTIYVSHDGVTMTNARCRIVAQRPGSIARALADGVEGEQNGTKQPTSLSLNGELVGRVKSYLAENKRKGRRNVSELTEQLWTSYLRRKGVRVTALAEG